MLMGTLHWVGLVEGFFKVISSCLTFFVCGSKSVSVLRAFFRDHSFSPENNQEFLPICTCSESKMDGGSEKIPCMHILIF